MPSATPYRGIALCDLELRVPNVTLIAYRSLRTDRPRPSEESDPVTRISRFLTLLLLPLLILTACGGSDDSAEADKGSETGVTASGQSGEGGSFVLYTGRDEELIGPIIDAFTEKTGIEVDVRYGNSAEMAAQLLEEGDGTPAHVFLSQEVGAVGALSKAGLLGDLPAETVARADARFRPADGNQWVGVTARSRVIAYNPDLLETAGVDVPTGVADLTDPAYAGMVAMVPSNASFQAFITAFRVSEGEDAARGWLEAMLANDADTTFESNGDVLEAVNNGDVAIGLINHYYWARHENRDQLEAKLVFPSGEDPGGLVNATAVAVTPRGSRERGGTHLRELPPLRRRTGDVRPRDLGIPSGVQRGRPRGNPTAGRPGRPVDRPRRPRLPGGDPGAAHRAGSVGLRPGP
jgi:iron(III) transport system substrate-binding protein